MKMVNPVDKNINTIKDTFVESSKVSKLSTNQQDRVEQGKVDQQTSEIQDVFISTEQKEELIKKIDQLIAQKQEEIKRIEQEIQSILDKRSSMDENTNPDLRKYLELCDDLRLQDLNMQKNSLENQITALNQRKLMIDQVSNNLSENSVERNFEQLQQEISRNYQISIDQLNSLKKQIENYQHYMNESYKKQIEAINQHIEKLNKEIEDLINQQPSSPEEAEKIAEKITEKRNLISTLKSQLDNLSAEVNNQNNMINEQIKQLNDQILIVKKQMQTEAYNKWAFEQSIRREIENILWAEMLNEKNHILNMWKMYYDMNQKINQMWRDIYLKKVQENTEFASRWAKALGV
ncbi:MAG: hypothetical protein ABDH21_06170 [bacterium]